MQQTPLIPAQPSLQMYSAKFSSQLFEITGQVSTWCNKSLVQFVRSKLEINANLLRVIAIITHENRALLN